MEWCVCACLWVTGFGTKEPDLKSLFELGWNEFFENEFRKVARDGLQPARVVEQLKEAFRVRGEAGELLAEVAGRLRHAAQTAGNSAQCKGGQFPAVGDWVLVVPREREGRASILGVLPRRSKVSRKVAGREATEQVIAANLDTIFVVSSLNRELNPRRIERYLAAAWQSGARPVVVLTKADLCDDPLALLLQAEQVAV